MLGITKSDWTEYSAEVLLSSLSSSKPRFSINSFFPTYCQYRKYVDISIEEIMDCIEGDTIQTGTALVSEDAANTIRGENPQFTAIGEAPAIMDLIFRSLVPSLDETIKINLHVDLEFQQDYDVPYPVEKRAFFYAVRRVSAQLPKVGKNGAGYKNLENVYSIWICMENIPKYLQGSISYHKMVNYKNTGMTDGKTKKISSRNRRKISTLWKLTSFVLEKTKKKKAYLIFFREFFLETRKKYFLIYKLSQECL